MEILSTILLVLAAGAALYLRYRQGGAAAEQKGYGHANLVMTLDRKGGAFPGFFRRLFSAMFEGASMPVAWARLAPQHAPAHADAPETIFAAERGQVTFAR
jgi:hypothetical protein